MITGDQALTACHVAAQVHIILKPTLILGPMTEGTGYEWVSPDETEHIAYRHVVLFVQNNLSTSMSFLSLLHF